MRELRFTSSAKKQYSELSGSQRMFIDQGLDNIKQGENISQEIVNKELKMKIKFKLEEEKIIITEIITDDFQNTERYKAARKQAKSWNN